MAILARRTTQRKTVFFIVEGRTDKTALEKIFQRIYRHKNVNFQFTNGDITSDSDIEICDLEKAIYSYVQKYISDNKLKKTDIWQIVQIFDTDGTYIPETSIVKGTTKDFVYSETTISCKDIDKVKERNKKKSEKMEYLLKQQEIKNIPYKGYYMSSNLDHALYDEPGLTEDEKKEYAAAFYEKFSGNEKVFIEFLKADVANGVPDNFLQSWTYIKQDSHSLERHTNLHLYFKDHPYDV